MTRPTKQFPFDSDYDFAFHPATYWPNEPSDETFLAKIRGTARRRAAERALAGEELERLGDADLYKKAMDFVLQEELDEEQRERWGRIDPQMMGGEYLPKMEGDEVEVARIDLESVTADALELRARRGDDGQIHYRLVDEYETNFELTPQTSTEPLRLGELIELIDTASDGHNVGLTDFYRDMNLEGGSEPGELLNFVSVSSAFYAQLESYYADRAQAWVEENERAYAENPPPPREPPRLMTKEELVAYMTQRLAEVEELMRGRSYREERFIFADIDERTKFLNEIGFSDDSAIRGQDGLTTLPDGRRVAVAYLTVIVYHRQLDRDDILATDHDQATISKERASERWTFITSRHDPAYAARARESIAQLYRFFTSLHTVHEAVGCGWKAPGRWCAGVLPWPVSLDKIEEALVLVEQVYEIVGDEKLSGWCLACRWQHASDPSGEKLLAEQLGHDPVAFIGTLPVYRSQRLPSLTEKYKLAASGQLPSSVIAPQ